MCAISHKIQKLIQIDHMHNYKLKTLKLLEKKWENLCDLELDKDFLSKKIWNKKCEL